MRLLSVATGERVSIASFTLKFDSWITAHRGTSARYYCLLKKLRTPHSLHPPMEFTEFQERVKMPQRKRKRLQGSTAAVAADLPNVTTNDVKAP